MPLKRSASDKARSENIAEMIRAGHPRNQAVAAAYRIQRESEPVMAEHKGSMKYEIMKDAMSAMGKGKTGKGGKGVKGSKMKGGTKGECKDMKGMKGGKPGKFGK